MDVLVCVANDDIKFMDKNRRLDTNYQPIDLDYQPAGELHPQVTQRHANSMSHGPVHVDADIVQFLEKRSALLVAVA